jgi:5-methyltetrahydropteroyltriglutamate--homocysteine methyltransferase
MASGGYEAVADTFFNTTDVDGFFLEYDTDRAGGFEPLRFVPKGKRVVLGLVSSKEAEIESKDALKRRIEEASRFIPLDQLCISPQCGFASTAPGNRITEDVERRKLQLLVEVANEVWGTAGA